jgi:hypothetical protein
LDLQIHDGADPGESVGKDPEQSAIAETDDIVSVLRTFVERKLSTRLRLAFTPSVIGEFFQIISQISVSSFARKSGLLAQCFRQSSSQPFSDQGL